MATGLPNQRTVITACNTCRYHAVVGTCIQNFVTYAVSCNRHVALSTPTPSIIMSLTRLGLPLTFPGLFCIGKVSEYFSYCLHCVDHSLRCSAQLQGQHAASILTSPPPGWCSCPKTNPTRTTPSASSPNCDAFHLSNFKSHVTNLLYTTRQQEQSQTNANSCPATLPQQHMDFYRQSHASAQMFQHVQQQLPDIPRPRQLLQLASVPANVAHATLPRRVHRHQQHSLAVAAAVTISGASNWCSEPWHQQQSHCCYSSKSTSHTTTDALAEKADGSDGTKYEGYEVYLDDTPDHAVQESVAAYSDLQEGEDFDSEWVDGAVINTYQQDAEDESELEYDVEFDEAWEDEEEVDDLKLMDIDDDQHR